MKIAQKPGWGFLLLGAFLTFSFLSFFSEKHLEWEKLEIAEAILEVTEASFIDKIIIVSKRKSQLLFYVEVDDKESVYDLKNGLKNFQEKRWPGHDSGCFEADLVLFFDNQKKRFKASIPETRKENLYLKLRSRYGKMCIPDMGAWMLNHGPIGNPSKYPVPWVAFDEINKNFSTDLKNVKTNLKTLDCETRSIFSVDGFSFDTTNFDPLNEYIHCLDSLEPSKLKPLIPVFLLASLKSPEGVLSEKVIKKLNAFDSRGIEEFNEEQRDAIKDFLRVMYTETPSLRQQISQAYFYWINRADIRT